jgi:hypothetical protein
LAGFGLEKPNLGLDPGETFFPNSVSDLDSAETFQISRNLGLDNDENVCLLDSQLWIEHNTEDRSTTLIGILARLAGREERGRILCTVVEA